MLTLQTLMGVLQLTSSCPIFDPCSSLFATNAGYSLIVSEHMHPLIGFYSTQQYITETIKKKSYVFKLLEMTSVLKQGPWFPPYQGQQCVENCTQCCILPLVNFLSFSIETSSELWIGSHWSRRKETRQIKVSYRQLRIRGCLLVSLFTESDHSLCWSPQLRNSRYRAPAHWTAQENTVTNKYDSKVSFSANEKV